jgi:putative hemolysin
VKAFAHARVPTHTYAVTKLFAPVRIHGIAATAIRPQSGPRDIRTPGKRISVAMISRALQPSPLRLFDRFWPMPGHDVVAGLLPTLASRRDRAIHSLRPAETLGRLGSLEVRLACSAAEVRKAQRLRYRVFYKEGSASADAAMRLARRDVDEFDAACDHLLVLDHAAPMRTYDQGPTVVGTYRLLRHEAAEGHRGFYSAGEFDIGGMIARHPGQRFLELGRSCVLKPYRNKRTVELLWQGIWSYVQQRGFDVMIGCASLDGTDPDKLALPLSFLHHYARAPEAWRASAHTHRHVDMNRMAKEAIDVKAALQALPPLIKGYLRLGAYVGGGAVVDRPFGTTDVLIVMPVSDIKGRYIEHFGGATPRRAA